MPAKKHYTKPGSIPYKEAGSRHRLMLDRLRDARWEGEPFPPLTWKIAAVVGELTASWSKAWDETYVATVARLAGVSRPRVSEWLPRMAAASVLEWRPSKWSKSMSLVGLPALEEADMFPHKNISSSPHVPVSRRNGARGGTLPKVTVEPASRPTAARRRGGALKCGQCNGPTTTTNGVATCDDSCSWSVAV